MVKVKVSYMDPAELEEVINLLKPRIARFKISKNEAGQYKKAYIYLTN